DQYNADESGAKIEGAVTLDLDGEAGNEIVLIDTGVKKLRVLKADGTLYKRWKEVETGPFPFVSARVADLDADGRDDLLLFGRGRLAVLYAGRTDPRLEEIASYESDLEKTFFVDSVSGDLNADGYTDIAILDTQSHFVEILDFDPTLGPRHATHFPIFEEKNFTRTGGGGGVEPREVAIVDVTNDGRADLILLVHDRVLVYPQGEVAKEGEKTADVGE
nr:VCBS repeat-containing protein [Planctomycetota bacterium]